MSRKRPEMPPEPAQRLPSWQWGDKYDRYEAILDDKSGMWTWTGPKDLGGGDSQSIADFLARGPLDTDAPDEVVEAIREAIRQRS